MGIPTIGFIINPIAGMGGTVALKGTDGMVQIAQKRGAKPIAQKKAQEFLEHLDTNIMVHTCSSHMGELIAKKCNVSFNIVYTAHEPSTATDTKNAAKLMKHLDIIIFVGGDGTAQDIVSVIDKTIPIVGVPSGVKMYSGVFATTPREAAFITNCYVRGLPVVEQEVLDINEKAFREGILQISLKGYALSPDHSEIQGSKDIIEGGSESKNQIATWITEEFMGSAIIAGGSTTYALKKMLGGKGTLLGVDIIEKNRVIKEDVTEQQILEYIQDIQDRKDLKIIVSPIGGQGFIFGRGNEQISPRVIKKVARKNILILATPEKLRGLSYLRVDTGNPSLDEKLAGYHEVYTGYKRKKIMRVR